MEDTLLPEHTPMREIARRLHESARDIAPDVAKISAYKRSRKDRKKVEILFAHFKRIFKLDRLRLQASVAREMSFYLQQPRRICGEWRNGWCSFTPGISVL